jgi:hypothetical protein
MVNAASQSQEKSPAAAPVATPVKSAGGQVVQRIGQDAIEDIQNLGGQARNKVMGKLGLGGGGKGEESGGGGSSNLEKLAEDVFPLIKRLLEIEKDRISGHLR